MKYASSMALEKIASQIVLQRSGCRCRKAFLLAYSREKEGATTFLAQLGMSLSKDTALSTLLIDGNLRSPGLHHLMNAPSSPGLTELCFSGASIVSAIQETPRPNLFLLPAGEDTHNPMELFLSLEFKKTIAVLKEKYDLLLFDSSPLAYGNEALALGSESDGAILLIRARSTSRSDIQRSARKLESQGIEILGTVLNRRKTGLPRFIASLFQFDEDA